MCGPAAVRGLGDAFVTKLDTAGKTFLYSTYLGGAGGCRPPSASGSIRCRTADGKVRLRLRRTFDAPAEYQMKLTLRRLDVPGPLAGPLTLTITPTATGEAHAATIAACTVSPRGINCDQP
jgi:hypothetical protein